MTKYSVICADPPWSFGDKLSMSSTKRGAAANYGTMRDADIIALPVEAIAREDSLLALWGPSSKIEVGLVAMKAWGFDQKTIFTWVKGRVVPDGLLLAFGMGHTFRGMTEHALIGTRGSVKKLIRNHSQRNAAIDDARPHSAKPDTLQQRLELMVDGPRLEMFARRDLPGWTCVGNECPSTEGVDIRAWLKRELTDGRTG